MDPGSAGRRQGVGSARPAELDRSWVDGELHPLRSVVLGVALTSRPAPAAYLEIPVELGRDQRWEFRRHNGHHCRNRPRGSAAGARPLRE